MFDFLGCRFMPQSLLYNTQSHISVHHNQSLPLCTGKLYTKMPIDLKSITDFKRTAQKQGNHCSNSHPSLHGRIVIGPLIASLKVIFSFFKHKSFRQLFGGNNKKQQTYLETAILYIFFSSLHNVSLRLGNFHVFETRNDEYFFGSLTCKYFDPMGAMGKNLQCSGSEHLKGEISPDYITLTQSSPAGKRGHSQFTEGNGNAGNRSTVTKLCL